MRMQYTAPKNRIGAAIICWFYRWQLKVHDCTACGDSLDGGNLQAVISWNDEVTAWHNYPACTAAMYHYIGNRE